MDANIIKDDPKQGVKSLRSFMGACNFYRSHIRNFTYTSAGLTNLTKKGVPWISGPAEEKCFQEFKEKIANAKCSGVARPHGDIILLSDASNTGGGGSLY